ncbi:MAG TPA: DUF983 domain-containing protein [Terriglobales bacterium]|nr:DUF983 domain-containing protein [Terriglobales bacterium]
MGARSSTATDILCQRCPRCRQGQIFRGSAFLGFPKMHARCPACDLRFEREAGYFLGAMYISYILGVALIVLIAAMLWWMTGWAVTKCTLWAVVLFLPPAPAITYFSRVLWIYLDQSFDPDRDGQPR